MIDGEIAYKVSDVMPRKEKRLREPCYLVCYTWMGHLPLMLLHEEIDSHGHSLICAPCIGTSASEHSLVLVTVLVLGMYLASSTWGYTLCVLRPLSIRFLLRGINTNGEIAQKCVLVVIK